MIVNAHDCKKCAHQELCRYREGYEDFGERLRNLQSFTPEVIPGNIQDNVSISVFCKHYTTSIPTVRSAQEMRIGESEDYSDVMQRLINMNPKFPPPPPIYEKEGRKE